MNWEHCIYCGGNINNESVSFDDVHYYHKVCWKSNFNNFIQIDCKECFNLCLKKCSNECICCLKKLESNSKGLCEECKSKTNLQLIIDHFKFFACINCTKVDEIISIKYIIGQSDEIVDYLCNECAFYYKCTTCHQIIGNDGHLCKSSLCNSDSNCFKSLTKEVRQCNFSYQIYQEKLSKCNEKLNFKFKCKNCEEHLENTKIHPTCLALNYLCEKCKWNLCVLQFHVQCECENCLSIKNHIQSIRQCVACKKLVSTFKDSKCKKASICSDCTNSYFHYFIFAIKKCFYSSCSLCESEYKNYQYSIRCRLCKNNINADNLEIICPVSNYFCGECFMGQEIFYGNINCECKYCYEVKNYLNSFKKCSQCELFKNNYQSVCSNVSICQECLQTQDQKLIKIIYDCSRAGCKYCEIESQRYRYVFICKLCKYQLDTINLELICYESNFFCSNCDRKPSINELEYSKSCNNCIKIIKRINHSIICPQCHLLSENYKTSACNTWEMCLDCIDSDIQAYIDRLILCFMENCSKCLNTLCECIHSCSNCKKMNYFPFENKCLQSKYYCKPCLYNEKELRNIIENCNCPYCCSNFENISVKIEEKSNVDNLLLKEIQSRQKELNGRFNVKDLKENETRIFTYDIFAEVTCINCKEISSFALMCNHNQCYTCLIKKNLPAYYEFAKSIIDKNLSPIKNEFILKCCSDDCEFKFNLPSSLFLENCIKLFSKAQEEALSEFIPYLDGLSFKFQLCECLENSKVIAKRNDCLLGCSKCEPIPQIYSF